jgi:DJ-1 family protein
MPRVLVPFAAGFEEIETATIVDVLRRAGVEVVLAGLDGPEPIRGSRGIVFTPDAAFDADGEWDLVILPGGTANAEALAADDRLKELLQRRVFGGLPVAAICAGPLALDAAGVLPTGGWTSYPGIERRVSATGRQDEPVVDHAGIVTSQGPGTAMQFALYLVHRLVDGKKRDEVAAGLLFAR